MRVLHRGEAKVWSSGSSLVVNIPREAFMLLAGVEKSHARRHGYRVYMAPSGDGCLRIAVRRTPPKWARASVSIASAPYTFRLSRHAQTGQCPPRPGPASLTVYEEEGGRYAVLCWDCGAH